MRSPDPVEIARQLEALRLEHRDLDDAISRMSDDPSCDQIRLTRMKKRKLQLKDAISRLQSRMIPDLDA